MSVYWVGMIIDYASLVDKIDVISQDAYRVGRVEGVRYDPHDYTICGWVVKCEKDVSAIIGGGSSKSRVMMKPESFEIRDVLLLADTVEDARSYIQPDTDALSSVDNLIGQAVVTADQLPLGTSKAVHLDLSGWYIHSFTIKLDKEAHAPLGLKKVLLAKEITGIMADHISVVSDKVHLTLKMEEVKEVMQTPE